jgi:GDP-mannose 6-dehydrogenase
LSTHYLELVAGQIGAVLPTLGRRYTVIVRSTMLPWHVRGRRHPAPRGRVGPARRGGLRCGREPGVPARGHVGRDFYDPPKTVIGQVDDASGDIVASLYEGLPGPVFRVPLAVAEMTKYVDNGYHALKIGFANEIGAVCKAQGSTPTSSWTSSRPTRSSTCRRPI